MLRLLSLAARNLSRNLRRSLISIGAVAFGLSLMIMTINLANGQYQAMIQQGISSLAGHVVVQAEGYQASHDARLLVADSGAVAAQLAALFPDAVLARRINLGGLVTSTTGSVAAGLRGVEPLPEAAVADLDEKVIEGAWLEAEDDRGILLGAGMADTLGVGVGDKVVFMGQSATEEVTSRMFRVRGLFKTGSADLDGFVAVVSLGAAQAVLEAPDVASQVTVHFPSERDSEAAAAAAEVALARADLEVLPWREAIPEMWAFIQVDKSSTDGLMAVLGLIVAMGVLNTVLMSVMERTREFGVLMAIGMRPWRLSTMVLLEGLVLGLLGAALGLALGALFTWPLITRGLDYTEFMGESTSMSGVAMSSVFYAAWDWPRVLKYSTATALVTVLASLWPAWFASRLSPVEAIRHA